MGKVIKLTESDIKRIVKRVLTEDQRNDIPKDVKMVYDKYLMSPEIANYTQPFLDFWDHEVHKLNTNQFPGVSEVMKSLANGFTFPAATLYLYGETGYVNEKLEDEISNKLLKYYDHEQIIRQVLENLNLPEKEQVYAFIDRIKNVTKDSTYFPKTKEEYGMGSKFNEGNKFYDKLLSWLKPPYFENIKNLELTNKETKKILSKIFNQPVHFSISQKYTHILFGGSLESHLYDRNNRKLYTEDSRGNWKKFEYDDKPVRDLIYKSIGNLISYETSNGYWYKREYDDQGNLIYHEDSNGKWRKHEYDEQGNEIYYENNKGIIRDNR